MDVRKLNIDRINRAFHPAEEIKDPELFVGREQEIEQGILSLMNRGGFLAIYGLRGVGKTSIAYQLKLIAEGRRGLVEHLGLTRLLPRQGFSYLVHYFRCDQFVKDVPTLLARTLDSSLLSLIPNNERFVQEVKEITKLIGGVNTLGVQGEIQRTKEVTYSKSLASDVIQLFRKAIETITKSYWQRKTGLLLLFDEFDVIPDKEGFASIVKTTSDEFVKFGIVGVATNIAELLYDHFSIGRQTNLIEVPLMPFYNLVQILKRAEHVVNRAITFEERARYEIAERSEGFPYFTHLLGKEAMLAAYRQRRSQITKEDVQLIIDQLVTGRLNTIYEHLYRDIVKDSTQRAILLMLLAEEEADEIDIRPLYKLARDFEIRNPSAVMREILATKLGRQILVKTRNHYYRFVDPVFKVYVKLRRNRI